MTAESRPAQENKQPDPQLLELVTSGHLIPLYRAYRNDELSPDIRVIAAFESPVAEKVVNDVKMFSFPMSELNLVQEHLKNQSLSEAARNIVDRFFRGLSFSPTVRYADTPGPSTRDPWE